MALEAWNEPSSSSTIEVRTISSIPGIAFATPRRVMSMSCSSIRTLRFPPLNSSNPSSTSRFE